MSLRVESDEAQVTENGSAPPPPPTARPVHPGSEQSRLQKAIQAARQKRHLDRAVTELPQIVVSYRTVGEDEREKIVEKYSKGGRTPPAVRYLINAEILAKACIGIFEIVDGEQHTRGDFLDADGEDALTFSDERFQEIVGATVGSSTSAVRALYGTDNGDVIGLGDELMQFSGFMGPELAEAIRGNS
jgi:hypothetical protein